MLIKDLARLTATGADTIRYYERIRVLPAPARTAAGHRRYDHADAQRLLFVRRARELGFALEEVRELLSLAQGGLDCCGRTKEMALRNLSQVREKISRLQKLERALAKVTEACTPGDQDACPIIGALSADS